MIRKFCQAVLRRVFQFFQEIFDFPFFCARKTLVSVFSRPRIPFPRLFPAPAILSQNSFQQQLYPDTDKHDPPDQLRLVRQPVADQLEPAADASSKKDVDGLKVLVLCAGAGTSAMLANAIKEGAAQTGENIASSAGAYGQHTAIMDQYDVIVLAPQVRSYYNDMKADTDRLGIKLLAPRGKEYIDLTRDPAGAIKWLRENLD